MKGDNLYCFIFQDSARKARRSRGGEEAAAAASPPGYVQNLVNKILSNVQVGGFLYNKMEILICYFRLC